MRTTSRSSIKTLYLRIWLQDHVRSTNKGHAYSSTSVLKMRVKIGMAKSRWAWRKVFARVMKTMRTAR